MHPWPYPFWFAHRGAGKLAPENTLAAFRFGAAKGFRAFECDVKLSADGVPYLLHDDDLDRTTDAQGPAGPQGWSAISMMDAGSWHSARFAGEPPASLSAVATFCQANNLGLNLEIKPCPGTDCITGAAVARWVASHWHHTALPPLLSSFEQEALAAARQEAPSLPRALLLEHLPPDPVRQALDLGCCALITHHPLMIPEIIKQAHKAGLRVLAYTVNEAADAKRLCAWGIDGLITDALDLFSPTP